MSRFEPFQVEQADIDQTIANARKIAQKEKLNVLFVLESVTAEASERFLDSRSREDAYIFAACKEALDQIRDTH